jgi:nitrate reductase NapAB chaperone NapD
MPISSYVIRCHSSEREAVARRLQALPGVEVGAGTANGIPVVVDSIDTRAAREAGERMETVPGVESAVLVYHNFEDE